MKIKKGPHAGYEVGFAASTQVERHKENLDKLLLSVGEYMGWDGDISHVFVTDGSSMGDFALTGKEINSIGKKLGLAVESKDLLYEIAMRMGRAN